MLVVLPMVSSPNHDDPFRAAFESASDSILFADRHGAITFWNPAAAALFGYSADEVVGRPLDLLMPPRFREAHRRGLARFVDTRAPRVIGKTVELAGLRKDGTEFPLELSLAFGQSETGVFFTGIIREITGRKQLEQMQAVQLAVTRVLAESASMDESASRILRAICELLGWEIGNLWLPEGNPPVLRCTSTWCGETQLSGGAFRELNASITFDRGVGLPGRVWTSGEPAAIEDVVADQNFPRMRAAAEDGLHGACAFPIVVDDAVVGVLELLSREIRTPDRGVLDVMGALGSQIGQFVQRKRAEGAQEQLRAKLMVADRMSSVGMLAAGVAHEINSPLAYVISNLEMIAEELRAPLDGALAGRMRDIEEMTSDAREGAERVRKIVRGMKTFSRADEERRVPLDVRAVLDLSCNMAFNEIRHRARLVKDYGDIPTVEADEARIGQVFVNLLINAAQAIDEGRTDENEIRISTKTDGAGRAVIEIRDTGAGIPESARGRIFDPFFTTKPIGIGSGLGLAICHGIVTDLGGEIEVESKVGEGSLFRVSLPAALLEAASPLPPVSRKSLPVRRGRVLVVDDDVMLGRAMRRILAGHDVTVMTSASEVRDRLLAGDRFDVILCDLMMPTMTGMQLHAELLREVPEVVERMVFMTGGAFTPSARAFLDEVSNERLEKPIDMRNLQAFVARFVG